MTNPFLEYVGSDFAGEDGLKYFWGHVTTDAAWREHHKEYGYRVKVRIIGKHPAEGDESEGDESDDGADEGGAKVSCSLPFHCPNRLDSAPSAPPRR